MKTRISKAYRNGRHIGWRKTIGAVERFLQYGTARADEAKAIKLAELLEAKWKLAKAAGAARLSDTDFEEAKALVAGSTMRSLPLEPAVPVAPPAQPSVPMSASTPSTLPVAVAATAAVVTSPVRHWLYASIDEFIAKTRLTLKADDSNGDNVCNMIFRISRAREAIADVPLDQLRRKELDDWLLAIRVMPSKLTGKPLGPVTVRNLVGAVRAAMTKFVAWEWWQPPLLWEHAFKGYSIKKLEGPAERKRRRKKPPVFTLDERRLLWHFARTPFNRAIMALAEWAGHTQKEIATLTFDEVHEEGGEMYIDRDRNKTGVHGRWWIPPEAAEEIRKATKETPRDPNVNPKGLALLTARNQPLVHRAVNTAQSHATFPASRLSQPRQKPVQRPVVRHGNREWGDNCRSMDLNQSRQGGRTSGELS